MAGRAGISGVNPQALRFSAGRPVFGGVAAAIAPADVQGPLSQPLDVTGRFKSLISGNTARPAAAMFPIWDRLKVVQGSPSAEDVHFGVTPGFQDRVTSVLTYDADIDSLDVSPRKMFPKDIVGMTVYSGDRMDLSDPQSERHFASRVMYEATKAGVIMRLLDVNRRFGPHFSYADIDRLHGTDGYFSWFAVLKVFDEQDSFFYDRTNLALGAIRALSGGFVTMSQINEENGRDRDTVIKTILSKFPFFRGEFKAACSVFYTLYVGPSQSKAVLGVRESVVRALKYLAAAEPRMYGVPFDKLDEVTQAHATVAIEETGHFLAYLRRSFPQMTNWFLVSPLGQAEELPHPLAGEDLFKGFVRMPERRYTAQEQADYMPGRCDGTDVVRSIIGEKMPGFESLMPETGLMTIMQGGPNHQEAAAAIKDIVSGRQYFLFEYEYASANPASSPNKRYPTGIRHCTLFSGDDSSLSPGKIGEFSDIAAFKIIQLRILGRLLEANKHGDYFSENDLRTILRSDAYIHMMSVVAFLRDIDQYKFDTSIIAGIVLTFFLAGNNNFGSGTKGARSAEQIGAILRKVPELAEEFAACQDAFRSFYVHNDANDPKDIERKHNIAYATVRCLELNDEVNDANEDEEMCEPDKRDFGMLYSAALDFIPVLKAACQGRENWLINAPEMQFPAILPEVAVRSPEPTKAETVDTVPVLNGDGILSILTAGFNQSSDPFLAQISCEALESLSTFGGRERFWLLPEIATLKITPSEESPAAKKKHSSVLAEALTEAAAERDREEAKRLSEIKYAARRVLCGGDDFSKLIARSLDDDTLMEVAQRNVSNTNVLASSMAANVMLNTSHIENSLSDLPENDPGTKFEVVRIMLANNLKEISLALSRGLTKGQRPVGLAGALVDFVGDVLDGKTMAVAFYRGKEDEEQRQVEEKYNIGLLDNISMAPLATALALELREINGQIKPSAIDALLTAEKLLALESKSGCFSSKRVNIAYLSESFERARAVLEDRVRSRSGEGVLAAASALAQLKIRNKEFDAALLEILVESNHTTAEDLGYTVRGFRALAQDRTTGAHELLGSLMGDAKDLNWAFFSAYMLSAGSGSLMRLSGFDINTASAQEIAAMLADAKIPTPERMAKLIIANRPYDGIAGFRTKKINGLGQSKEQIAGVFERSNGADFTRDIMFRALCSGNPVLTAMAVTASNYLREKKPS